MLANINHPQGKQFLRVIRKLKNSIPKDKRDLIAEIEKKRKHLLQHSDPPIDESFGCISHLYNHKIPIALHRLI
jgi:hypothetical protein